jgi:hypothetical protein
MYIVLWWHTYAKEITPIASNTPGRTMDSAERGGPRSSLSTAAARRTTEETIIPMEINATLVRTAYSSRCKANEMDVDEPKLDDLESLTISVCRLRGRDTQIVQGMVSPVRGCQPRGTDPESRNEWTYMITLNAHMLRSVSIPSSGV